MSDQPFIRPINGFTKERIIQVLKERNDGTKSQSVSGGCVYRSPSGTNHCFIGCFIPDELYKEEMEGYGPMGLLAKWPELKAHMPLPTNHGGEVATLTEAQLSHDSFTHYPGRGFDNVRDHMIDWVEKNVL